MKKLVTLATVALLVATAGTAFGAIGWAGNVWPNNGAAVTPIAPVDVYAQVWEGGVTDAAGQGANISATMSLVNDLGATMDIAMGYHGDVGNNDEYSAQIPTSMLVGAAWVQSSIVFHDEDEMLDYGPITDQAGNAAPQQYNVVNVTPVDIDVTFSVCLSGAATAGDVCVIGSAAPIGTWGAGVNLTNTSGDLWEGVVTFPAGSNPAFEYKFKKDGCATWESVGNRAVTLPTDGTASVVLDLQSWDNLPLGCGVGQTLAEDKVVCFQVCVAPEGTNGGVCVTGGLPELTGWGDGLAMTNLSGDLWQACLVFPAGTAIPLNFEYKFKKDACGTWESVGNRAFTVDNGIGAETTLTFGWNDGENVCAPVDSQESSWGSVKGMYR
ncbi:MAG TPA: carbohydrate-binding module family 20 domain-containing protein [Candidatus Krumholzibacteria bacterium]|nr:carbohydrate-binding module family 20 domain-containing protein [Candidatus Krumholzibacteria bacterium]